MRYRQSSKMCEIIAMAPNWARIDDFSTNWIPETPVSALFQMEGLFWVFLFWSESSLLFREHAQLKEKSEAQIVEHSLPSIENFQMEN